MASERPYSVSPGWRLLLVDMGLSPANVLQRAELPADLFARQKASLSTAEYFRMWRAIEAEADDPRLPLRVGAAIKVEAFDPPIFAAVCSPNLNVALARLAHYKRLCAEVRLLVDVKSEATTLVIEWPKGTEEPPATLHFTELVFFVQLARLCTREEIRPLEITAPVLPENRKEYRDYFGVPIKRGEQLALRFSAADAARPFLTANDSTWAFFEKELSRRLSELDAAASSEERVHAALLELLPSGRSSIAAVAKKLGTSARTLQRRLKAEGFSFQAVLDDTREALARHYLKSSDMTGAEISFLLGYEDPNSFFRAFSNWTGTTPESIRRQLLPMT